MENLFGITQDDINDFAAKQAGISLEDASLSDLILAGLDVASYMNDPTWLPQAKLIARLPGIGNVIKVACIFLGPHLVLSQLLLLYLPYQQMIKVDAGMNMFIRYCEIIGVAGRDTGEWIASYFSHGILIQNSTPQSIEDAMVIFGPTASHVYNAGYASTQVLWEGMASLEQTLIDLGVVFEDDLTLLPGIDTSIVSVDSLAPDV